MKKILPIIFILILSSCSNKVPEEDLQVRKGITYEVNSSIPFTGNSTSGYYKDGKREGLWKNFRDGKWYQRGNYKDGKKEGTFRSSIDGTKYIETYKNGVMNGPYEGYHYNGEVEFRVNFKNGKKDGLYERFDSDGSIHWFETYKDGKLNGPYKTFFSNGQVGKSGNYKDGERDGLWEQYFDNGQLRETGKFYNGRKDGLWKQFEEDNGNPTLTERYFKGKLTGCYKGKNERLYKKEDEVDMWNCENNYSPLEN